MNESHDLVWRVERADARNSLACAKAHAESLGTCVEWRWLAGGYAIFAGYWTHLTQAIATGLSGPVTRREIAKLTRFFTERFAIPVVHIADSMTRVLREFRGEGFREIGESHVMVRRIPRNAELRGYGDPAVRRLTPRKHQAWIRAASEGFLCREAVAEEELITGRTLVKTAGTQFYVMSADGEIAGTAAVCPWSRVAIFFGDSTRVNHRGLGVQTGLIKSRLAYARNAGCSLAAAVVQPGGGSERNYRRCGFRKVYSRITVCRE